eukprot:Sdes_comp20983_c0_seq7m19421
MGSRFDDKSEKKSDSASFIYLRNSSSLDGDFELKEPNEHSNEFNQLSFEKNPSLRESFVEARRAFKLAWPCCLANLLQNSMPLVNVIFSSRLGSTQLAAVGLGGMFVNVFGVSICFGLSSAIDTLASQAYGVGNFPRLGVILQRAILIIGLACILCMGLMLNVEQILIWARQDEKVSQLAGQYCFVVAFGLPFNFLFILLQKYMQSQGTVLPSVLSMGFCNILNIALNWIFIYYCHLGFFSVSLATAISWTVLPFTLLLYMYVYPLRERTWFGWSRASLMGWGEFCNLAIPGLLMVCLEWWCWEILTLVSGTLGEASLAAQVILLQTASQLYMIPSGIALAANIRVGHLLGGGKPFMAKRVAILSLGFSLSVAAVICFVCFITQSYIPQLFTDDASVIAILEVVFPLLGFFHLLDSQLCVCAGVLRGMGRQSLGAYSFFFGYYILGMPLGSFLAIKVMHSIEGLWYGLAASVFSQIVFMMYMIFSKSDWIFYSRLATSCGDIIDDTAASSKRSSFYVSVPRAEIADSKSTCQHEATTTRNSVVNCSSNTFKEASRGSCKSCSSIEPEV